MKNFIAVAFNLPIGKFFWYQVPSKLQVRFEKGQRVLVPFKKKQMVGFVVKQSSLEPQGKVREVISILDKASPFTPSLFKLAEWISYYYACSLGQALYSVFPFSYPYPGKTNFNTPCAEEVSFSKQEIYLVDAGERKFEFAFSRIKKMQNLGRQVLFLLPEISLISGFQERMQRCGIKSIIFHSKLSPKRRYRYWLAMKEGKVNVAVGTRSIVFSPFSRLGLIIVDEEESTDYKQKETPKYNTRRVAIKRGQLEGFPVILMSSSPSLESWYNTKKGIYSPIHLSPKEESSSKGKKAPDIPSYHIVDLRKEKKKNRVFSVLLQEKIKEAVKKERAVLLFVPRRGYANFLLCGECGEVIRCPNCSIGLNFHLKTEMICHWCGFRKQAPGVCPFCEGRDLRKIGWGTQRVELEVKRRFPQAKVERFDLDAFKSFPPFISRRIKNRQVDILVGTQLLMKEEVISMVDVVGIILLDTLLNLPDFRASEHTFHLLSKTRGSMKKEGSLIVQTYNPTYYALTTEDDKFYSQELKIRETLRYPPFERWVRILLEGRTKSKVKDRGEKITKELEKEDLKFLGPSPCPFPRTRGKYRYHIILRDDGKKCLEEIIGKITSEMMRGSVKVGIDVDPLYMM